MFRNDYSELGAPEVLDALCACQKEQQVGYGLDTHSAHAAQLICSAFGLDPQKAAVHFLAGGTQTNLTILSYFLRPYEAVIACDSGHINVHETGAVEGTGHKVLTAKNEDGKLRAEDVRLLVQKHRDEHMVKPRMVYVSESTETGTVYTRKELQELRTVCDELGLLLFVDGARLGVALTVPGTDVDAECIGSIADVFYVGGTKNGALFGEAVVFPDAALALDFRYHIKNRGAMLAKGFAAGIQFEQLFTDGLYWKLARHSNEMAALLRKGLQKTNVPLVGTSPTNQIFLRLPAGQAAALMNRYGLELWEDCGAEQVVRAVTSFATRQEDCEAFLNDLSK